MVKIKGTDTAVAFADMLVRKQVKMIGLDMPSPDKYPFENRPLELNDLYEIMKKSHANLHFNEFKTLCIVDLEV